MTFGHIGTRASNWRLDVVVRENYLYLSPDGYITHKKSVWDRAKKMGLKENEYATSRGYIKLNGKCKNRYILELTK